MLQYKLIFQLIFATNSTVCMIINMYITMRSLWHICFLVLFIDEVSLQKPVDGFDGSSAVLPCHSGNKQLQSLTAHWRYKDINNVYDIQSGKGSAKEQHPDYRGRTQTFAEEYTKGNFSLKLQNLRQADAGIYCCFIPDIPQPQCTELRIKERPREIQQPADTRNLGVETKAERIVSLLIPFFSINILLCI